MYVSAMTVATDKYRQVYKDNHKHRLSLSCFDKIKLPQTTLGYRTAIMESRIKNGQYEVMKVTTEKENCEPASELEYF